MGRGIVTYEQLKLISSVYLYTMKLYLFFALIDLLIILVYPFIYIASKMRRYFGKHLV